MRKILKGILTLFLVLVVQFTSAQDKMINGAVSDSSGFLLGVSVLAKGTTNGS
jgi:hypothetical protein